jgi:hypothetical protein
VDDILLIWNDIPLTKAAKFSLRKSFSMNDLGEVAYILGIKIYRDISKRLIRLSQDAYIDKILNRFNMHDSKKDFLQCRMTSLLAINSVLRHLIRKRQFMRFLMLRLLDPSYMPCYAHAQMSPML